ncbi:urease accessory protein UreD [Pseudolysobacter antarcticus]|uniref:urease accessory protein UreD n=1 Tax=Pseudolysobacter antarcticus TaxID=2511995 RepID=UPI001A92C0A7|nr:urease accessory protein UreD [Pseudolysobacter antarcticus]
MNKTIPLASNWHAELDLEYRRVGERTLLAAQRRRGPLCVQKALYPEGDAICHSIILHPPGGIAAGDQLYLGVDLGPGSHSLLTTPGASKWYRSDDAEAAQQLHFTLAPGAMLEWLPQETILFRGTRARLDCTIDLAPGALFLGWEVLCFGRRASGEIFDGGRLSLTSRISQSGKSLWRERGRVDGASAFLTSPVGLAGCSVSATLILAGTDLDRSVLDRLREIVPADGAKHGITLLPQLAVARYLGDSNEAARGWMIGLWSVLRPAVFGRPAQAPRIWST